MRLAGLHIQDDHHIDNPDQRICDDVPQYTDGSVFLVTALIKKLFNCVAFTGGSCEQLEGLSLGERFVPSKSKVSSRFS